MSLVRGDAPDQHHANGDPTAVWRDVAQQLIGVIDLADGVPVHAVAGQRNSYRPLIFPDGLQGLVRHYDSLNLSCIYIADLDAIMHGESQLRFLLDAIAQIDPSNAVRWYIDVGWRGDESSFERHQLRSAACSNPNLTLIAATETMLAATAIDSLLHWVSPKQVCVSLDFKSDAFLGNGRRLQDYLQYAHVGIDSVIALDVSTVGTSNATASVGRCRIVRSILDDQCSETSIRLIGGGGVRAPEDVKRFITAGCDRVLVATAILPTTSIR